jgi:hypothetical protein
VSVRRSDPLRRSRRSWCAILKCSCRSARGMVQLHVLSNVGVELRGAQGLLTSSHGVLASLHTPLLTTSYGVTQLRVKGGPGVNNGYCWQRESGKSAKKKSTIQLKHRPLGKPPISASRSDTLTAATTRARASSGSSVSSTAPSSMFSSTECPPNTHVSLTEVTQLEGSK